MRTLFPFILCGIAMQLLDRTGETPSKAADYAPAAAKLEKAIRAEMAAHQLHGIAVALVDDQQTVYRAGFGNAAPDSIFRAGSVSKLFNAIAVMQQVEQGKIDLDSPIQSYGPQFNLVNPFEGSPPITIRQLLCHRSGMIRESPLGGYFDPGEPGLGATVASIRNCVLVNLPNTKTRYSNIGPSIAGQIVAAVSGTEYVRYQKEHVLDPLGMSSSSFALSGIDRKRLATSYMRVADGRGGFVEREAPVFNLGTLPAGNLFTTAEDLARFAAMLAADGRAGGKQIVSKESLAKMWTPQLTHDHAGYGIGFMVGKFREHKAVSHSGAVYGHSTSFTYLPELKIAAILLCDDDIVNGNVGRMSNLALGLMLEAKLGEPLTALPKPIELSPQELARFAGDYESPGTWAKIELQGGRLTGSLAGQPVDFTPVEPLKLAINGRTADGSVASFSRGESGRIESFVTAPEQKLGQKFVRIDSATTAETCPLWNSYVGSYGPDFIPLVISIRHGHLYLLHDREYWPTYRLTPVNVQRCSRMPAGHMQDEHS